MKLIIDNILQVVVFLFDVFCISFTSTHWVVTENGRIQSQVDSVYRMNKPYDLIEFLKQEERAQKFVKLYEDVINRKMTIDRQLEFLHVATESEKDLYVDDDCRAAKEELLSFDSTNNIDYSTGEYNIAYADIEEQIPKVENYNLDCARFIPLDFSMKVFPHLQVLSQPWNLTWPKEPNIFLSLTPQQIYNNLKSNKTSWYHFNLASLYWRKKGEAQKALDCVKRSILFAPRNFKDVPMLNLGIMLQKVQCVAEAAILLHAVIDHAPRKPSGHFILATIYSDLADYERSLAYYNNALSLSPNWGLARKARHSLLCHNKVQHNLNNLQNAVQDMVNQFQQFHVVHEQLYKNQEEILSHQQKPSYPTFSTLISHLGECLTRSSTSDRLACDISKENIYTSRNFHVDAMSLQLLLSKVESQAQKMSDYIPITNLDDSNTLKNAIKQEDSIIFDRLLENNVDHLNMHQIKDDILEQINFFDTNNFTNVQIK